MDLAEVRADNRANLVDQVVQVKADVLVGLVEGHLRAMELYQMMQAHLAVLSLEQVQVALIKVAQVVIMIQVVVSNGDAANCESEYLKSHLTVFL